MTKYSLESIEKASKPGFILNTQFFTLSIEQLRKAGATKFGIMGVNDDRRAFWQFDFPDGKNLPLLVCQMRGFCKVERID